MGTFSKGKGYKTKLKIRFLFRQSLAMLSQKPGNKSNKGENETQPSIMYKNLTGNYLKVKHKNSDCVTPEESRRDIQY